MLVGGSCCQSIRNKLQYKQCVDSLRVHLEQRIALDMHVSTAQACVRCTVWLQVVDVSVLAMYVENVASNSMSMAGMYQGSVR